MSLNMLPMTCPSDGLLLSMQCHATFNAMPFFGHHFGVSMTEYSPWLEHDGFESTASLGVETTHSIPQSSSALPTLQSIDDTFLTNVGGYVPSADFSLSELVGIALSTLGKDSLSDIKVLAYGFGSKVYSLTFSDGTEAVVRLPHVNGELRGPKWLRRILECEVATMKYAKEKLPPEFAALIPTIYAWDAETENIVGQQYMIMEKIKGVPFVDVWDDATLDQKRYVVEQLARFTYALHSIGNEFTGFGSIYFDSRNNNYYIGPYVSREWNLQSSRSKTRAGPWTNSSQCFIEQLKSRLAFYLREYEYDPDDDTSIVMINHLENLSSFASVFDASVIDGVQRSLNHRSLFHNDLHARNFLVDPTTMQITGILDWEGMGIFPDWMSMSIPAVLEPEKVRLIWKDKEQDEIVEIFREIESLREWYLLERSRFQPGYSDQIGVHTKLHRLYKAIFLDEEDLEDGQTFTWDEEKPNMAI